MITKLNSLTNNFINIKGCGREVRPRLQGSLQKLAVSFQTKKTQIPKLASGNDTGSLSPVLTIQGHFPSSQDWVATQVNPGCGSCNQACIGIYVFNLNTYHIYTPS
jgi:hypothetical protein